MPGRGASLAKRLDACARGMGALEASAASARLTRRELTDEEIVEIVLTLLIYLHGADVGSFAGYLVQDLGLPLDVAEETAGTFGRILEGRRASAANPKHPV